METLVLDQLLLASRMLCTVMIGIEVILGIVGVHVFFNGGKYGF